MMDQRQQTSNAADSIDLSAFNFSRGQERKAYLTHGGVTYASRAELACAVMLERYVPGFEIREGETYQAPYGLGNKHADFRYKNLFIEYHPIYLKWAFRDKAAYKAFERGLQRANKQAKKQIRSAIKQEMRAVYTDERQWTMRHSALEDVQQCHLIVVCSAEEFVKDVLIPLSGKKLNAAALVREFNRIARGNDRQRNQRHKHRNG